MNVVSQGLFCIVALTFAVQAGAVSSIAYSPTNSNFPQEMTVRTSSLYPSIFLSESAALSSCKKAGGVSCKVVISISTGCAALAATNEGITYTATSGAQDTARSAAMNKCLAAGMGVCSVRGSICNHASCDKPKDNSACQTQGASGRGGGDAEFCRSQFC